MKVLPPRDPILGLALVHGEKSRRLEQPTHEVSGRELIAPISGLVEETEEALQGEPGARAEALGQLPRRIRKIDLFLLRRSPEHVHGGRADATSRGVDYALERQWVTEIPYQPTRSKKTYRLVIRRQRIEVHARESSSSSGATAMR